MAVDLQGQFVSVVHSVAAADADLQGMFSSVVHSVAAADADLQGMFSSVVHSVAGSDADLQGMWTTVVHNDVPAPPSGGGGVDLQGEFLQGIRMQSWGLQGEQAQGE